MKQIKKLETNKGIIFVVENLLLADAYTNYDEESEENERIYVPAIINKDSILNAINLLYRKYDEPNESNEFLFSQEMVRILYMLDIYDEICIEKYPEELLLNQNTNSVFSKKAQKLARQIKQLLLENEGCAEMYPYEEIDQLNEKYNLT